MYIELMRIEEGYFGVPLVGGISREGHRAECPIRWRARRA